MKPGFGEFFGAAPDRLHFAAHSHHPWPDVAFDAHKQYWLDSAQHVDDKWERIFGDVIPQTQRQIANILGLSDPSTLTFAPNTHDFVVRIFSCLTPPVRVLTTGSEFHSFARQSKRWEEEGLATVERIDAEPFDTFSERFSERAADGGHDLVYLSSVMFDSGHVVEGVDDIVGAIEDESTYVVIDGYHQFMARPTQLGNIEGRAFFLAGGYKYAMSGEGVCFLHAPSGYGPRPVDTGWYAGFGQLESGVADSVPYAGDGSRFAGATYDPSGVYRMRAVLGWLESESVGPTEIHHHVEALQARFLDSGLAPGELLPPIGADRGNFLTFRRPDAGASYSALHERGVVTDYRSDRLRIGFGVYQDASDIDRLVEILGEILG